MSVRGEPRTRIGFVAPGFVVPRIEMEKGLARLRDAGLEPIVHPQVFRRHLLFAGTDQERADALLELARDPSIPIIWCARGGFGAARFLPLLARAKKPPRKLLCGYSDVTALHAFVSREWGWPTLHAPMPGGGRFLALGQAEWHELLDYLHGGVPERCLGGARIRWIGAPPAREVTGKLAGGNLVVWASLAGTRWWPDSRGTILFFEDIGESLYRIDRALIQVEQAGGLRGVRAIVLGDFTGCRDYPSMVCAPGGRKRALRPLVPWPRFIREIVADVAHRNRIPLGVGIPAGHGDRHFALPLGARCEVSPGGGFRVLRWDWSGPG